MAEEVPNEFEMSVLEHISQEHTWLHTFIDKLRVTSIPPDLKVREDGLNKRLKAVHYTIMPSKPIQKESLKGQLDNFVRSTIVCQWQKARGL